LEVWLNVSGHRWLEASVHLEGLGYVHRQWIYHRVHGRPEASHHWVHHRRAEVATFFYGWLAPIIVVFHDFIYLINNESE